MQVGTRVSLWSVFCASAVSPHRSDLLRDTHKAHAWDLPLCVNFLYMGLLLRFKKIRVSDADLSPDSAALLLQAQERGIAAGRRRIDGERALGGEAVEVARAAGLRP